MDEFIVADFNMVGRIKTTGEARTFLREQESSMVGQQSFLVEQECFLREQETFLVGQESSLVGQEFFLVEQECFLREKNPFWGKYIPKKIKGFTCPQARKTFL